MTNFACSVLRGYGEARGAHLIAGVSIWVFTHNSGCHLPYWPSQNGTSHRIFRKVL